jgi:hypothetical protein
VDPREYRCRYIEATSSDYRSLNEDSIVSLSRGSTALGRVGLGEIFMVLFLRAVERLLEDRLGLVDLKLGLEVGDVVREAAAVGATARVGKSELLVSDIIVDGSPVATARAVLLHLFGVDIGEAVLAKEARHSFRGEDSPLGNALVVTVIGLVGSSHFER